jgi:FkbM family methyltransferase
MFDRIKSIIKVPYLRLLNNFLAGKYSNHYETKIFLGKKIQSLKGTILEKADYDEAWLYALSQNTKIMFDVGCHWGKSALIATSSPTLEKIYLIDPNPLSLSKAAENLIMNDLISNAVLVSRAAYKVSGDIIKLWTMPGAFSGASIDINFTESGRITKNFIKVKTISLDDLAKKHQVIPDLIKIDVEGAEANVLQGAVEIAQQKSTTFIIEVHSCNGMSITENTSLILNWCTKNQYYAYYLSLHEKLTDTKKIRHRGRYHVLLLPKNKKYPNFLKSIKQGDPLD